MLNNFKNADIYGKYQYFITSIPMLKMQDVIKFVKQL